MQHEDKLPEPRENVLFNIEMALKKAERLWPRRYRPGDHDRFKPMAGAILEHLELCRLRFFRKPPRPWHSTPDPQAGTHPGRRRENI